MYKTRKLIELSFRPDCKMLVVTGSEEIPAGQLRTGLTDEDNLHLLKHHFYIADCKKVGVKNGSSRRRLPIDSSEFRAKIPDITKLATKLDPPPADSFYSDENMKEMDIRVANMAYYYGHTQKFIDDINQFQPSIIILPFSYGSMCDVSILITRYCHLYRVKQYKSKEDFNTDMGI